MKDVDKELTNEKEEHFCDDIGCIQCMETFDINENIQPQKKKTSKVNEQYNTMNQLFKPI